MPHRVQPDQRIDRNELDILSSHIASFFTMNDEEVIRLRVKYNNLSAMSAKDPTLLSIVKYCSFNRLPIFVRINELRENRPYSWNSFFQFVTFTALAPTVSTIFFCLCMILDFNDDNPNISLDDIHKFCEYLQTAEIYDEGKCTTAFNEIDTNNDGFISLSQFFTFVSKINELFVPLCDFRLSLINRFFPHEMAMNILQRRAYINSIREYKMSHGGTLPPLSCKDQIFQLIFSVPNRYQFDYDPNENVSVYELTRSMILKYRKEIFLVNDRKILCTKKQIPKIINLPKIQELDKIYTAISCGTKQCGGTASNRSSAFSVGAGGDINDSRNNSRTSMSSQQNGLSQRPHSILKSSSSYHHLHSAKSMKTANSSCVYDFNANKKLKKNLRTYKSANQSMEPISPHSPVTCLELPGYIAQ